MMNTTLTEKLNRYAAETETRLRKMDAAHRGERAGFDYRACARKAMAQQIDSVAIGVGASAVDVLDWFDATR